MAFGKAIETQFRSIGGELYRIEVYLWDYVSAQHEIDADVPGFELSYPSGPRHHFPVRGSSCDVHLVVDDNTQLNLINQIILAPEGDVRVNIDKWNGASFEALWRGKGIPSESSYTYEHFPTGVTIFATDGLSDLREKTFPDDTPQELSMIEIISICLEQTGLQLDIVTADDWYPLGATMNDETDPLDIVSINPYRTYAKEREDEVAEIEGWRRRGTHRMPGGATGERQRAGRRPDADQYADCYKILTDILINKFLELRQSGGVWRIIQRPENLKSSYNIRTYNYAGVRQSHGSLNPRISLEGKDWERVPDVLNTLALKSAAVSYYHGKIIEVFSNLDWSRWTVDGIQQYPEGWTWTSRQYPGAGNIPGAITRNPTSSSRGGDVRGRQSDYAWMMASVTSTPVVPGDLSSLKRNYVIPSIDRRFRFRLSHQGIFSEHGYNIDAASRSWFYVRVKIGSQYLDRLGDLNVSAVWLPVNLGESMQTLEVETDNITIDSEIEIEISAPILTGGGSGLIAALVGDVTVDLIEEDTDEGDVVDESVSHDTIAKITDSKNSEHFEPSEPVYHGDGPTSFHLGHMVFDGSPTELWRRSSVADDIPIHRLLTMFFLRFGLATRSIFKGKLIGEFLPHNIIQVDGKWRLFDSGSFNPNTDTWEGEWYELKDDAAAILYQDYIVDNPSGRGSFGSSEQTLVSFGGAFENLITNRAIALTTSVLEDGTQYTEIPISAIGETLLNSGDTIVLINRATAKPEYLTVTDTQQPSDTVIKVEQFTPDEDIVVNSSVQLTDSFIKSSIIATNEAIDLRVTHEELDTYFNLTAHWARLQAGVFSSPDWNGQINNKNPGEWEPGDGDGEITNEGTQGWAISLKGDSSFHNAFIRGSVISDSIIIDPVFSSVEITDGKFRTDAVHFQFRNLADNAFKPVRVGTSVADANDALNRAAGDGRYGRLAAENTWTQNNYFNGNVGINTTSPAERLHVEGFARTSSGYKVGTTTVIDSARNGFLTNLNLSSLTGGVLTAMQGTQDAHDVGLRWTTSGGWTYQQVGVDSDSATARMRISRAFTETSEIEELQVYAGLSRFSNNLRFDGNLLAGTTTVIDSSRNITAVAGEFSNNLSLTGSQENNRFSLTGSTYLQLAVRSWGGTAGVLFSAKAAETYENGDISQAGNTEYAHNASAFGSADHRAKMIWGGHSHLTFSISETSDGEGEPAVWQHALRIHSSGRVSVGTVTDTGDRINVNGAVRTSLGYKVGTTTVIDSDRDGFLRAVTGDNFISGWTGSGWRITQGAEAELTNLRVRGRLDVYELMINQIRATNGNLFVTSAARVESVTAGAPGQFDLTFEDNIIPFAEGDILRAQRFTGSGVYQSDVTVLIITGNTVTVDRLSGSDNPQVGMDYVRLGSATISTRRGTIYLSADDSGAPFIDVVDGVTSHAEWNTAGKIKSRIGKLDGITSGTNEWGIIAGRNGFGVNDSWIKVSNVAVILNEIDEMKITTGKFDLRSGNLKVFGDTTSSFMSVGTLTSTSMVTTDRGFYVDNSGDLLLKGGGTSNAHALSFNSSGVLLKSLLSGTPINELAIASGRAIDPIGFDTNPAQGIYMMRHDGGTAVSALLSFGQIAYIEYIGPEAFASLQARRGIAYQEYDDATSAVRNFFELSNLTKQIAGINFDHQKLWTGSGSDFVGIQARQASDTKVFFAGATNNSGADAKFFVTADGELSHASIINLIFSQGSVASNTVDAEISGSISWTQKNPALYNKAVAYYIHRFGTKRIYFKYRRRLTNTNDTGRIRLSFATGTPDAATDTEDIVGDTSWGTGVLSIDVSSLTANQIYSVNILMGAWQTAVPANPANGQLELESPVIYGTATIET